MCVYIYISNYDDFADEERERGRRLSQLFWSFSSRKMNSKAEISKVACDCSVQKFTSFIFRESYRESPASYYMLCSRSVAEVLFSLMNIKIIK